MSEWTSVEHAFWYLSRADSFPHRTEGEAALIEQLPVQTRRVLDLGTGDGRLLGLVKLARPGGYADVDCYWKWLEMALLGGTKPGL